MESFSIQLLSNSSMDMFPNNTAANFTVQLPRKIILNGKWRVVLTEIQHPAFFDNVTKKNNIVGVYNFVNGEPNKAEEFQIKIGNYKDVQSLVNVINQGLNEIIKYKLIEYNTASRRVKILKPEENQPILYNAVHFENKLALQLGFTKEDNILKFDESPNPASVHYGLFDRMFIYCDIIDTQIIGHIEAQVLKILTCQNMNDDYSSYAKEFHNLEYVNVAKKEFDSIDINIKTITGEPMPFTHGTSILKLKFEKLSHI